MMSPDPVSLPDTLRDIHGLDSIPWWPLAPGWWGILGVLLAALFSISLYQGWQRWYSQDWRHDAHRRLRALAIRVHQAAPRDIVAELASLLRRVAMARHGRAACASLTGPAWLAWLEQRDPQGFPWTQRGQVLITLPYAPLREQARDPSLTDPEQLRLLISAALAWVTPPTRSWPRRRSHV